MTCQALITILLLDMASSPFSSVANEIIELIIRHAVTSPVDGQKDDLQHLKATSRTRANISLVSHRWRNITFGSRRSWCTLDLSNIPTHSLRSHLDRGGDHPIHGLITLPGHGAPTDPLEKKRWKILKHKRYSVRLSAIHIVLKEGTTATDCPTQLRSFLKKVAGHLQSYVVGFDCNHAESKPRILHQADFFALHSP